MFNASKANRRCNTKAPLLQICTLIQLQPKALDQRNVQCQCVRGKLKGVWRKVDGDKVFRRIKVKGVVSQYFFVNCPSPSFRCPLLLR